MKRSLFTLSLFTLCVIALWGCRKKAGGETEAPGPATSSGEVSSRPGQTPIAEPSGQESARPPAEKIALKVFYAGQEGTERAKGFADFLAANFVEVGQGNFADFRPDQAAGYDVVILDYDGLDLRSPIPDLPRDYARATVTMGVPGADLGGRLNLKTGYL